MARRKGHLIICIEPLDRKTAKLVRPNIDDLRRFLDSLDQNLYMSLNSQVWRPIGIVYEETDTFTREPTGFHPRERIRGVPVMQYIAQDAERRRAAAPPESSAPVELPAPPAAEQEPSRARRKIIIKAKGETNGSSEGNTAKD